MPPPHAPGAGVTGRLVVLASGNGSNLQALLDDDLPVVAVVSNRRAAYASQRAASAGVPAEYLPLKPFTDTGRSRREYDAALADVVARYEPDFVVLAGWMHILSAAFLDRFPSQVVNLHPALPGTFPGAHAIDEAWAAYGAGRIDRTGVMTHLVPDEGVDVGPVLGTVEVAIRADDTLDTLTARIHEAEYALLPATLRRLLAERHG